MFDLLEVLKYVVREEGSDLHLKVGSKPLWRINGRWEPIEQFDKLTPSDTERVAAEMLTDPEKQAEFEAEVDFPIRSAGSPALRPA